MDIADKSKSGIHLQRFLAVFEILCMIVLWVAVGMMGTILLYHVAEGRMAQISTGAVITGISILTLVITSFILSMVAISMCRREERAREALVRRIDTAIHLAGIDMTLAICDKMDEHRDGSPAPKTVREEHPAESAAAVIGDTGHRTTETAEKKYDKFRDIILLGVENYPGVVCLKSGEGWYDGKGEQLVDGLFEMNRDRVAICTFSTDEVLADRFQGGGGKRFSRLMGALFHELHDDRFTRIFLVFDSIISGDSLYAKAIRDFRQKIGEATFGRFELFEGTPNVVIPKLTARVDRLMTSPSSER